VGFEPTEFHTSRAFGGGQWKFVTAVVVPATDGVVDFTTVGRAFRASVAQLGTQGAVGLELLSFLPNVTPRLASHRRRVSPPRRWSP